MVMQLATRQFSTKLSFLAIFARASYLAPVVGFVGAPSPFSTPLLGSSSWWYMLTSAVSRMSTPFMQWAWKRGHSLAARWYPPSRRGRGAMEAAVTWRRGSQVGLTCSANCTYRTSSARKSAQVSCLSQCLNTKPSIAMQRVYLAT